MQDKILDKVEIRLRLKAEQDVREKIDELFGKLQAFAGNYQIPELLTKLNETKQLFVDTILPVAFEELMERFLNAIFEDLNAEYASDAHREAFGRAKRFGSSSAKANLGKNKPSDV